ncbi:MAG: lipoyl synthase [Armatimonadota bacterium]
MGHHPPTTKTVRRLPPWLKVKAPKGPRLRATKGVVDRHCLHTVCESAKCPNIGECFSHRTATFMILGSACTRNCTFCAVEHADPQPVDPDEPDRVAAAAAELGLRHVVVTSVTRDDLPDGGAEHFAQTIRAVRARLPEASVEVLTPDFEGREGDMAAVAAAGPDVYNHNVETVPRLYSRVRPEAEYARSLHLLEYVKRSCAQSVTKSGLMVGLGETDAEVVDVLRDLRAVGCDSITVGQYLRPSPRHLPVERYVPPEQFAEYARAATELGFGHVASAPFVRSSYNAAEAWAAVSGEVEETTAASDDR